ncbi:uncharacterized protein [Parasteatoda tepidariorum]|nr:putative protein TPRXL [Parasteatoda tepidariorum]
MRRLVFKELFWTFLLITVVLRSTEGSLISKRAATKAPSSSSISTTASTVASVESSTRKSTGSRTRPKATSKRKTTTTTTVASTVESTTPSKRPNTSSNKKKPEREKPSTTTLSPIEVMNRLYQMHGMASHGVSMSHSYPSSSSTSTKKKEGAPSSSSMDEIYRLHAMAMAQASHSNKKKPESLPSSSSESFKDSSHTKQNSQSNSMENIYQQHSSLPSSMHHIMAQHSQSSSRPQKTESVPSSSQDSHSSLSSIMQPLLKQLTPVGAGISVVLAPLLLFNGFLTFFSNMSRFLNSFAQTILPVRRPGPAPNQPNFFQNIGPDHLQRQPRDWLVNADNLKDIHQFAELILKALRENEG